MGRHAMSSVKSAGPLCCHAYSHKLRSNRVHMTKCLQQHVGGISMTEV